MLSYLAQVEFSRGNQVQAVVWLKEAEDQLSRHPQARRFYQLRAQLDQLRRSLTELAMSQTATD
ncbi:MAG: hypothetical protein HYR94_11070 [Chloroflexi bacterium]|nr:hypothetical protein [Chloroflexota bacterium]